MSEFLSKVDSDRFGFPIARATVHDVAGLDGFIRQCIGASVRMAIIRCSCEQVGLVHSLEGMGARLMDTLVYFRRNLRKGQLPAELRSNPARLAGAGDLPQLESMARLIFKGYQGHYHADPLLDQSKCDDGYAEWATSMCQDDGPNSAVMVCDQSEGQLAGFATLRMNSPEEGEGVLFGVHPSAEGRGLYWSFMVHGMAWCRDRGATTMVVSTQITNLTVQKAWSRLGFEPSQSCYTFHLWF
jgi:GNAT superfamily N-acetyltransferase